MDALRDLHHPRTMYRSLVWFQNSGSWSDLVCPIDRPFNQRLRQGESSGRISTHAGGGWGASGPPSPSNRGKSSASISSTGLTSSRCGDLPAAGFSPPLVRLAPGWLVSFMIRDRVRSCDGGRRLVRFHLRVVPAGRLNDRALPQEVQLLSDRRENVWEGFPGTADQLTLTSTCWGLAFSSLTRCTVSTPSLNSALTLAGLASSGSEKLRPKLPQARSTR